MVILNREQNLQQRFKAVQFDAVWSVSSLFSLVVWNQTWPTLGDEDDDSLHISRFLVR